jgi:hypothetical protein
MDWTPIYVGAGVIANWLILYFWQPWTKGYAEEKGKTFARTEDIDKLAAEVRVLTKEAEIIKTELTQQTETIKAQLSQENWERQQRWLKRFDAYVDIIARLRELRDVTVTVRAMSDLQIEYSDAALPLQSQATKNLTDALEQYAKSVSALQLSITAGRLMFPADVVTLLEKFQLPPFDRNKINEGLKTLGKLVLKTADEIVVKARIDLGYESDPGGKSPVPSPSSPHIPSRPS